MNHAHTLSFKLYCSAQQGSLYFVPDNLADLLATLDTARLPQERVQLFQNAVRLYTSLRVNNERVGESESGRVREGGRRRE